MSQVTKARFVVLPLLILSIIAVGLYGCPTTCSSEATKKYTDNHTTAEDHKWKHVGQVETKVHYEPKALDCRMYCQRICEGRNRVTNWTCCEAFTSLVNRGGGTCQCWGWDHKPNFVDGWSNDYRSGWCE